MHMRINTRARVMRGTTGDGRGRLRTAGDVENIGCGGNDLRWGFYPVD